MKWLKVTYKRQSAERANLLHTYSGHTRDPDTDRKVTGPGYILMMNRGATS
jgi:hypothetical protein